MTPLGRRLFRLYYQMENIVMLLAERLLEGRALGKRLCFNPPLVNGLSDLLDSITVSGKSFTATVESRNALAIHTGALASSPEKKNSAQSCKWEGLGGMFCLAASMIFVQGF